MACGNYGCMTLVETCSSSCEEVVGGIAAVLQRSLKVMGHNLLANYC